METTEKFKKKERTGLEIKINTSKAPNFDRVFMKNNFLLYIFLR
jgi:hypothetical protein